MSPEGTEVSGKKLLPMLTVGCLIFTVVMFAGTFLFAKLTTPYFEKRAKQMQTSAK
jgi:hypothetical protein